MKYVVYGGGPGATALAIQLKNAQKNLHVTLLETSKGKISPESRILIKGQSYDLKGIFVSDDLSVLKGANAIFCSNPYNSLPEFLKKVAEQKNDHLEFIYGVPAASGFDWMVRDAFAGVSSSPLTVAIESLPFVAKNTEQNLINIHGYKKTINMASTNNELASKHINFLEKVFGSKINLLDNFLNLHLLNPGAKVNPLLFLNAIDEVKNVERKSYSLNTKYENLLKEIEREIQLLADLISSKTDISFNQSLSVRKWFDSCYSDITLDTKTVKSCLETNDIYKNLKIDFFQGLEKNEKDKDTSSVKRKSRYLTEQIPYGLLSIKGISELFDVKTPHIDKTIKLCEPYLEKQYIKDGKLIAENLSDTSTPQRFNIDVASKLTRLYRPYSLNLTLEKEEFNKNGFTFMGKVIDDKTFSELNKRVSSEIKKAPKKDTNQSLLNLHWSNPWFLDFCCKKEITALASQILGEKNVQIFSSLIVVKEPHSKMIVPWHQDAAYDWPLNPVDCASIWIALDDVTLENGAMSFIKGAHKRTFLMEPTPKQKNGQYFFSEQLKNSIPDESIKGLTKVQSTMLKQECSFHHIMIPHASPLNVTNSRRCAFIIRYCRENAEIKKYKGMPREEFFYNYKLFKTTTNQKSKAA